MVLDTKKGDTIQKRIDIPKGKSLMHNFASLVKAEEALGTVYSHYNLPQGTLVVAGYDDLNPGMFAVIAGEDTYVIMEAVVNWRVEQEIGITYTDTGGSDILDLMEEEGWIVIHSAKPTFQSDVEHMTDEELRASIEELQMNRIKTPPAARRKDRVSTPPMSGEDKKTMAMIEAMPEAEKLELMRKLGLIE